MSDQSPVPIPTARQGKANLSPYMSVSPAQDLAGSGSGVAQMACNSHAVAKLSAAD